MVIIMGLRFTEENFKKDVLESDLLVVVDFYADWCGPCQAMAPVIDELAEEYDGIIKVGKLNVDEYNVLASRYQVMTIPTILFFKNGEIVNTVIGAVSKSKLQEKVEIYK